MTNQNCQSLSTDNPRNIIDSDSLHVNQADSSQLARMSMNDLNDL